MTHRASDKMKPALIRLNTVHAMSWARISQKVGFSRLSGQGRCISIIA